MPPIGQSREYNISRTERNGRYDQYDLIPTNQSGQFRLTHEDATNGECANKDQTLLCEDNTEDYKHSNAETEEWERRNLRYGWGRWTPE